MAKKSRKNKQKSYTYERLEYFSSIIDEIVDQIDDDMLEEMCDFYKEHNIKFKMPTKIREHTIVDLDEPIDEYDRISTRYPSMNDLREYLRIVAFAAVLRSNWYTGISLDGYTECDGPCIVRFNPDEKRIYIGFIAPLFLYTSDIDNKLSEYDMKTKIMNDLIVDETVNYMARYSVKYGDYGFDLDEKYTDVYERVNAAIEQLVEKIDLKEIGGIWMNGGLILVNSGEQIWFMLSPVFRGTSAFVKDLPDFHKKEDLDKWRLA